MTNLRDGPSLNLAGGFGAKEPGSHIVDQVLGDLKRDLLRPPKLDHDEWVAFCGAGLRCLLLSH